MLNISQAEIAKFQKSLEPARLADTIENAAAIAQYVKQHNLPHTAEGCRDAVKAILFQNTLVWAVEPAALKARKENEAKIKNKPMFQTDAEFKAKVDAAAQTEAKKKSDTQIENAIKQAIDSYLPVGSNGRVSYAKQAEVQKLLRDYVQKEVARNSNRQQILDKVTVFLADSYAAAEKNTEKL